MSLSSVNKSQLYYIQCYGMLFAYADKKLTELQNKYPDFSDGIQELANSEPIKSKSSKYLEWAVKVLVSNKAKSREIIDVLALFDKLQQKLEKKDINTYKVEEFTQLRDKLFELSQYKSETKIREEEKSGAVKLLDNDKYLLIRTDTHGSVCYYGRGTKWCITMKNKPYYSEYVAENVVFYMLINKELPPENPKSKIAFAVIRNKGNEIIKTELYDALDDQIHISSVPSDINNIVQMDAARRPRSVGAKIIWGDASDDEILANINDEGVQAAVLQRIRREYEDNKTHPFEKFMHPLQDAILKTDNANNAFEFAVHFTFEPGVNLKALGDVIIRSEDVEKAIHFLQLCANTGTLDNIDKEGLEKIILEKSGRQTLLDYFKNLKGFDLNAIVNKIIELNDPHLAYEFARQSSKDIDIKSLEQIVINSGLSLVIFKFASNVPGADIKALEKALLLTEDGKSMYGFALHIPGADVEAIKNRLRQIGAPVSHWLYRLERDKVQ